jgi:hypothetical protein
MLAGADAWGRGTAVVEVGHSKVRSEHIGRLAVLRQEFLARSMREDFRVVWWRELGLDRRRTFCALAGLDDSVEFSARRWEQISLDNQLAVSNAARDWALALQPMRLA